MNPNEKKWKEFQFIDVFEIKGGFYNKKPPLDKNGSIPFIGATANKNGVTEFYKYETIREHSKTGIGKNEPIKKKIFDGNCICVTNNGSVGYAFYQTIKFTCSHDVNPLYLKGYTLNKYIASFLISAIEQQRVCFEYSRKWRPKRMVKSRIMLPVNDDENPDWKFMEDYAKEVESNKVSEYKDYAYIRIEELEYIEIENLEDKEWEEFRIEDVFKSIQRGKRLIKANQVAGSVPYVSSTAMNNGVDNFIEYHKGMRKFENCLSLANSGSVGSCFYEPFEFIASDHITHLKNDDFNEYVYLFIASILNRLSSKYNFNREINDKRLSREVLLLPVDENNKPDYKYMEQCIKNMMLKKYNQYLEYKD